MEFSLVSAHKSCLGWAWSHRNPATEIRHPLSSRYFGLHQKMESLVESHNYQQSLGLRLLGLLSRLSQIHKQIQIKRETRRVLRLRQLKNKNTQKHWNDVTWVKTREESATIPQAQNSFVSPESPRENTALASKLGICGTMSKNGHDEHINAYHVFETRIRKGAGPHLRMPASRRRRHHRHHPGPRFLLRQRPARWNMS